ncbi:MAG: M48 family metallopeptidase [Actinomycetota bacterium]|jgi:Zn-dependent protease with chaperone function|nr:M48 family metallopeptidase [Actinomycetota bacterium]
MANPRSAGTALVEPRRFAQISAKAYEHPADRAATSALHSIPMFDRVVRRLTELGHERSLRQVLLGNAVRLGDDQVPATWATFRRCLVTFDLDVVPALYVMQASQANAMTIGANSPIVLLNSGLVTSYTAEETHVVLAHETAHVLSDHVQYTTMLALLGLLAGGVLSGQMLGLPVKALMYVLLEWSRAAELSSDRAAALAVGDPLAVCRVLMRLAGGAVEGMNLDAFIRQATEYDDEEDLFARHGRFRTEAMQRHPFPVRRVKELVTWVASGEYDRISSGSYVRRGEEPPVSAELQAAVDHYRERFVRFTDRTLGGVERVEGQIRDWLRRRGTDSTTGGAGRAEPAD